MRLRGAERVAALLLLGLSLMPLEFAAQTTGLVLSATGECNLLCGVFGLFAWLLLAVSVAGVGLAISIWVGTRLGPVVGAIVAGVVLANAVQSLMSLLAGGFGPGDDEIVSPLVVAAVSAAALLLLGASLVTWLRRLRAT